MSLVKTKKTSQPTGMLAGTKKAQTMRASSIQAPPMMSPSQMPQTPSAFAPSPQLNAVAPMMSSSTLGLSQKVTQKTLNSQAASLNAEKIVSMETNKSLSGVNAAQSSVLQQTPQSTNLAYKYNDGSLINPLVQFSSPSGNPMQQGQLIPQFSPVQGGPMQQFIPNQMPVSQMQPMAMTQAQMVPLQQSGQMIQSPLVPQMPQPPQFQQSYQQPGAQQGLNMYPNYMQVPQMQMQPSQFAMFNPQQR